MLFEWYEGLFVLNHVICCVESLDVLIILSVHTSHHQDQWIRWRVFGNPFSRHARYVLLAFIVSVEVLLVVIACSNKKDSRLVCFSWTRTANFAKHDFIFSSCCTHVNVCFQDVRNGRFPFASIWSCRHVVVSLLLPGDIIKATLLTTSNKVTKNQISAFADYIK